MKSVFENYIKNNIDYSTPKLFSDITGMDIGDVKISGENSAMIISAAEQILEKEYTVLPASVYMQFKRNGNRSVYEGIYFERRRMTALFLLAEYVEKKGRFTDRLIDGLQLILEETTWVIPAHNKSRAGESDPISYCYAEDVDNIDLFAAETGSLLAWIHYLGADILDAQTKIFRERILYELDRRIIKPFFKYDDMWWMGTKGNTLNNWTPWIVSNILGVCILCVTDTEVSKKAIEYSMLILDRFTKNYFSDGGCDEGPSYWGVAGASYFDCCELLYDLSGGQIDVFDNDAVIKMGEYIAKVNIKGKYYLNFADCPAGFYPDYYMINRFGRRCKSDMLINFSAYSIHETKRKPAVAFIGQYYRNIKNLCEKTPKAMDYSAAEKIFFDGICVMAKRSEKLYVAAKGGHNAESHNHNDVGSFVAFASGEPIFIDVGVGTYTADTFNSNRWKIWTMRSEYHNLPTINGKIQPPGGQYKAVNILYNENDGSLQMNLKDAYPNDSGISEYTRKVALDGNTISVCDDIKLDSPGTVEFNLMTVYKPDLSVAGFIQLTDLGVPLKIEYDKSLTAEFDEIEITDKKISSGWSRDKMYRIRLRTQDCFKDGKFLLSMQSE